MTLWAIPALYRRAILIYLGTIVVPVVVFLGLGVRAYQEKSAVLKERTAQQRATEIEARIEQEARRALFDRQDHAIAQIAEHWFTFEDGRVVRPALRAPLPAFDPLPPAIADADRLESSGLWARALAVYASIHRAGQYPALALAGMARCQEALGRPHDARATWRTLATSYPDERDALHRPYAIVAAMNAGDRAGLYDAIESGRWELPGDYAAYVLEELDPTRTSTYLRQFQFARELSAGFDPPATLGEQEVRHAQLGTRRIFYRSEGPGRFAGFSMKEAWRSGELRRIDQKLEVAGAGRTDLAVYGGSMALVVILLSAGVVLLLRDVSREARTNQARAELVSSVSHELKTPITLVRLYSETLLRHQGFSDEDRLGFYRIIARESTRLGRLVDQVLTFSRVDRGAQVYHFEEGDIATVVAGVVDDYREYLEQAGFSLRHSLPPTAPPVRFDDAAISQALVNLLDNAVKYSGTSREVAVQMSVAERHVAIEVEDHGIGIPGAEHEKIFGRFYRAGNGNGKGGYGLGLFLVRHIMDAHGGRTEVDSEPGRGSRFRLILPTHAS